MHTHLGPPVGRQLHPGRWLLAGALTVAGGAAGAEEDFEDDVNRKTTAIRAESAPIIDGIFDDPVWQVAPIAEDFVQHKPSDGPPPTLATHFQVAFDDANLYVAITLDDPEPELIVDRIHRRDQDSSTDWTGVMIDGFLDRRTARFFFVNAGGVQQDGIASSDSNLDAAWDAVWESAVRIVDDGWRAELRIPLNALRFNEEGGNWGFTVFRYVTRLQEQSFWTFIDQEDTRFVSRFGQLEGVKVEDPPLRLTVTPYISATALTSTDADGELSVDPGLRGGVDVRYGITPQITLDATVYPDFGQVEVDQAEINLGAFEVFYPEKRPFFLDGADVFNHPGDNISLYYSRRIGARGAEILGAAKVTGRTTGGLSLGFIEGVVGANAVPYETEDGEERRYLLSPVSNYAVARVKQEIGGYGSVGAMVTGVTRPDAGFSDNGPDLDRAAAYRDAYTGAADFRFTDAGATYSVTGVVAGSYVREGEEASSGGLADVTLNKDAGDHLVASLHYDYVSADVDLNDMGFLQRRDQHSSWAWVQLRDLDGFGPLRQIRWNSNVWGQALATARVRRSVGGETSVWMQMPNFAQLQVGGGFGAGGYDPYEARAGFDHLFLRTPEWWNFIYAESDPRRTVIGSLNVVYGYDFFGGKAVNLTPSLKFQLGKRAEFELGGYGRLAKEEVYWVENLDADPATDDFEPQPVFGRQATVQGDLYHRGMLTFSRNLSLQYFTQFQVSKVGWRDYYELLDDGTLSDALGGGYAPAASAFARTNYAFFQANVRLRWEYRPGSEIYLVWTHSRYDDTHPDLDLGERLYWAFHSGHDDAFVLKLSYRWGAEDRWPRSMFSRHADTRQI